MIWVLSLYSYSNKNRLNVVRMADNDRPDNIEVTPYPALYNISYRLRVPAVCPEPGAGIPARLPADLWFILGWYAAAYAIYRLVLGLPFDAAILADMHFLQLDWLKNDLFASILYLHSQPPLMNLLTGILLKLWPEHYPITTPLK